MFLFSFQGLVQHDQLKEEILNKIDEASVSNNKYLRMKKSYKYINNVKHAKCNHCKKYKLMNEYQGVMHAVRQGRLFQLSGRADR